MSSRDTNDFAIRTLQSECFRERSGRIVPDPETTPVFPFSGYFSIRVILPGQCGIKNRFDDFGIPELRSAARRRRILERRESLRESERIYLLGNHEPQSLGQRSNL